MKKYCSLAPALIALLSLSAAATASAVPAQEIASMHPVDRVNIDGNRVTIGSSYGQVARVLGKPARTMTGNPTGKRVEKIWVYENMEGRGPDNKIADDGCHTFLVTLTDVGDGLGWKVSDMKLVNRSADRFYTAQLTARPATTYVASR